MRFEVKKSDAAAKAKMKQPFFFVLIANNGETIMLSEMYARKRQCFATIRVIQKGVDLDTPIIDTTRLQK